MHDGAEFHAIDVLLSISMERKSQKRDFLFNVLSEKASHRNEIFFSTLSCPLYLEKTEPKTKRDRAKQRLCYEFN